MSRIPSEVLYVEDELGVVLFNLSPAELRAVKKACDMLLSLQDDEREMVYTSMAQDKYEEHYYDDDERFDNETY